MADWTTPTNVSTGVASASKFNEETVANLLYLYEGLSWTDFTPTWNNVVLGTGSSSYGRYRRINNVVEFQAGFKLGSGGSVGGVIIMTGPLTVEAATGWTFGRGAGVAFASDASLSDRYEGSFTPQNGTTNWVMRLASEGSTGWSSSDPFTWAQDDELHVSCTLTVQ